MDKHNWDIFQLIVNSGGLTWEFSELSHEIDFMDVTIDITGNRIETNLFENPWPYTYTSLPNHATLQLALVAW